MTPPRELGASGLMTPPLVLGGNVFGWTADEAASFRILDRFVDAGGTMIDTADVYSSWIPGHRGGESETIIGAWLRASGKRDKVLLATKVGMLDGDGGSKLAPARIVSAAEASLRRLGVDAIDLYFAHQDDEDVPQADVLAAFDTLIKAGKVRVLGASNFHAARLKSALDVATRDGLPHYRVLQPEYNLVSRHKFEGELQDLCITHNIGVVPYYGLASGFLTGKYRGTADLGKSVRGGRMAALLQGKGGAVLAAMDEVAAETGASLAQIALAWLAAQDGVTAPIASATSIEQLDELVGAAEVELTRDQRDRLTAAGA
ncbi:aldo/keto reductase [Sphingomonas psychrotolerans]|uniref:Alcohol dehydrogenase n=1 Tax=Sphingomonas psychrotolerans TaxID=1327635 RepID=A0A2K8ML31_9SPHN|nr:aldo/keto reductase [Sphingomonas psychrotolerans]ATY32459.1 alcohol dehydrogenase [Sphingomonas psychrotolerans]